MKLWGIILFALAAIVILITIIRIIIGFVNAKRK